MSIVEEYIPIEVVQIKLSAADRNLINPKSIIVGRTDDFSEISRCYIKYNISKIPLNAIIYSATLSIPVVDTKHDSSVNGSYIIGYVTKTELDDLNLITWNNLSKIKLEQRFFESNVYSNSILDIDVKELINTLIKNNITTSGLLFINNEAQSDEVIINGSMVTRDGLALRIRYYNPNERSFEKKFNISVNSTTFYSVSIVTSFLDNISVFIKNNSNDYIKASLEISADNIDFIEDNAIEGIVQNESRVLVPYHNGKYIRIKLSTQGNDINVNINFQAQLI